MGDIKPIGSEKLEGMDKLRRIMEIAKYKEVPRQEINDLSTTNYTIRLADGNLYGIVKEKSGYIIKKGLNESNLDYSEPMRSRKHYRSYADAMKKLNLVVSEVNRNEGNVFEVPLIGEQSKKKFILKTPKAPSAPVPGDDLPPPAPAMETPPAPEGGPAMPPAPEGGSAMPPAPEGGPAMPPAPEGGPAMPPAPEGDDMGMPPAPEGDDMAMPPAPEGDDMAMPPMGDEEGIDSDEEGGPMSLKMIQKLTGKLSQKIRSLDKDKGMDSQDIKYVINSIISAIDLKNLDDDDREEIVDKIEGFDDEYGTEGEGELDLSGEDMGDMGDMGSEIEPEIEPEMGAEIKEPKEGYQNVMDSIFAESKIDKLLSNYFNIKTEEKPIIEHRTKMNYLGKKIQKIEQKKDLVNFSVTTAQEQKALSLFEGYANTKFIGRTNKQNLVLIVNGKEVKVTPNGRTI